jgi:hypothetical protein
MRSSLLALALLSVSACSSGGGDLNNLVERPKPLGNPINAQVAPGTRLKDGQTIKAEGVVVIAVDNFDETNDGKGIGDIYVQDPVQTGPKGTAWSGLKLYRPAKNPPDLELSAGHGVNLVGEFSALTQPGTATPFDPGLVLVEAVTPSVALTFEGAPPVPIDLTFEDVADKMAAQQYQNRLVRFRNVTLTTDFTGSRREAKTNAPFTMTAKFFPIDKTESLSPKTGTTYKSVTGIFDFFYSYKLCPRSATDVEL